MKTTTLKPKELKSSHKAVAPVIATLLMVAIAVVGGTIIFVFSQGFFSSSQISGTPQIEAVKIEGYDARAVPLLQAHTGLDMALDAGDTDSQVEVSERVAIYVTNNSVQKIVLGEVWLGGFQYDYVNAAAGGVGAYGTTTVGELRPQNYTVVLGTDSTTDNLLDEAAGEIQAGQTATIIMDLESDLRIGRSSQFKITTSNGNVFVGTISVGQQSG